MKKLFNFYTLLFLVTAWSCTEKIEPKLKNAGPMLVVDGLITNIDKDYVKLTWSNSFYNTATPPPVNNASVVITDNTGLTDTLQNLNNDGIYYPPTNIGETGKTYNLTIVVNGTTYTSSSFMPSVTKIDSIYYKYYKDSDYVHKIGYYLYFDAKDPQNQKNFYLWKFYDNGKLQNKPTDIQYASDANIKGNIVGLEGPYPYQYGDTAKVEMYSLTQEAYNFYDGLNKNINNDGGLFSTPPSNPPSNVSNGALGLFQVSSVEVKQIVIQ